MPARITTVLALLAAGSDALSVVSSYKSYKSRRHLLSSLTFGAAGAAAVLAPTAAFASGVSLEEAAINAEKYRVKGKQCTPTNPADCTARYNQMLDPRAGRTKEELEARYKELSKASMKVRDEMGIITKLLAQKNNTAPDDEEFRREKLRPLLTQAQEELARERSAELS